MLNAPRFRRQAGDGFAPKRIPGVVTGFDLVGRNWLHRGDLELLHQAGPERSPSGLPWRKRHRAGHRRSRTMRWKRRGCQASLRAMLNIEPSMRVIHTVSKSWCPRADHMPQPGQTSNHENPLLGCVMAAQDGDPVQYRFR